METKACRTPQILLAAAPTATHVAGYHMWNQVGRSVKKGEKGIMISAPMVVKRESVPDRTKPRNRLAWRGFAPACLFDVAQTEGRLLPEFAKTTGDPKDHVGKLKALVEKQGIAVEYDPTIAPAQGVSSGGHIRLMPDIPPAEEFSVLAHELAHEMIHHDKAAAPLPKAVRIGARPEQSSTGIDEAASWCTLSWLAPSPLAIAVHSHPPPALRSRSDSARPTSQLKSIGAEY